MPESDLTLDMLIIGDSAHITSLNSNPLSLQLLEIGFIPGELVSITGIAPFGDPIRLQLHSFELFIRREDAALIHVEKIV